MFFLLLSFNISVVFTSKQHVCSIKCKHHQPNIYTRSKKISDRDIKGRPMKPDTHCAKEQRKKKNINIAGTQLMKINDISKV